MILLLLFLISSTLRSRKAQKPKPKNTLCACAFFFFFFLWSAIRNAAGTFIFFFADFLVGVSFALRHGIFHGNSWFLGHPKYIYAISCTLKKFKLSTRRTIRKTCLFKYFFANARKSRKKKLRNVYEVFNNITFCYETIKKNTNTSFRQH